MVKQATPVALALLSIGAFGLTLPALAQATSASDTSTSGSAFPDTPQNHWAYSAVQDLANKGLVKGYPNGKFLGNRSMSRYEFATVIDRLLQTIDDLKQQEPAPPAGAPQVTQDDLNTIQVLVDTFKDQLTAIQTDISKSEDEIESLRQDVLDTKAAARKAQDTANNSYGFGANRKFTISGYIQARYIDAENGTNARFPNSPAASSPYNGNYMQNGARQTFAIRRARLKFTGQVTPNTKYAIQIDTSGVANPVISSTPTALSSTATPVSIREANIGYTPGDGTSKYPTFTVGQFANTFGYELPLSSAATISPERPLAFNEGGSGLFNALDYVRGVQVAYGPQQIHFCASVVNSNGYASNSVSGEFDGIYRLSYLSKNKVIGAGVSYDQGQVNVLLSGASVYSVGQRDLGGADAQITLPSGPFVNAEYVHGRYDLLSAFSSNTAVKVSTSLVPGNDVTGYYVQGGYTFRPNGSHPFSLVYSYDVLQRAAGGPAKSASDDDVNDGYGVLYNLDKATRLRFWYTSPEAVAHASGSTAPPKIGLVTSEVQVKF